jgi:dTDP-4-amino-4,6-dideoxygalactose transaminase
VTESSPLEIPFGGLKREAFEYATQLEQAWKRVTARAWYVLGPEVSAFEAEFASFCGATYGVGVASGTDAITLALSALELRPGDEVIAPALTSVATATAILRAGGRLVLADVDPITLTIDPEQVAALITNRTRAVVPVHLYGRPAEMQAIIDTCRAREVAVIEDCAQSHGARYAGKKTGSLGLVGCFSFYPSKNLGALGDGGMIVTSDPDLKDRLELLRQYGWRERDRSELVGFNSRLDELQAALLRAKLPHLEGWNLRRRAIAHRYDEAFAGPSSVRPSVSDPGHVYHLYVIRVRNRDEVRRQLAEAGIGTGVHYPIPIHMQPAIRPLIDQRRFPSAEAACAEVLSLPVFPQLTEDEITRVTAAVSAVVV